MKNHDLLEKDMTVEDMIPYMGMLPTEIMRDLIPGITNDKIQSILTEVAANENQSIQKYGGILYSGVQETLKALRENHSLYIVSNCQDGYIEAFLAYFGFEDLFLDFESHGRTGKEKAYNIQLLMERNNLLANESVYIGDTLTDYESSKANGLDFIFCEYGFGEIEDSNSVRIKEFSELIEIL